MTTPKWLQRVPPEEAAQMVRALIRKGHAADEKDLILELAAIGVRSKNAGEGASIEKIAAAVAAGRRIKRVIAEIEMENDE